MKTSGIFANKLDELKNYKCKIILQTVVWALLMTGIFLIILGQTIHSDKFNSNVCYDIGLGILSSSVVSLIFLYIQFVVEKIRKNEKRIEFYNEFYFHCYNMLTNMPNIKRKDVKLTCQDFIIEHHREYHETYKKMIAENADQKEIKKLEKNLNNFIIDNGDSIVYSFEPFKSNIECFKDRERELLSDFFLEYRKLENINNLIRRRFYAMANFMTTLRQMISTVDNLATLNQIFFEIKNNKTNIDQTLYFEKEKVLKFVNDFNEIRHKNIIENYSKKDN